METNYFLRNINKDLNGYFTGAMKVFSNYGGFMDIEPYNCNVLRIMDPEYTIALTIRDVVEVDSLASTLQRYMGLELSENKVTFLKYLVSYKIEVLKTSLDYLLVFRVGNVVTREDQTKSKVRKYIESLALAKVIDYVINSLWEGGGA